VPINKIRRMMYCVLSITGDYCSDEKGIKLTYDEMVAVVGIEGEDHGNDGLNSMSEYGDRIIRWYAEDPKAYLDFTFRA
jgi:hypothetical protein